MQHKRGIPVSPGVAISPAFVLDADQQRIARRTITRPAVTGEIERLNQAVATSITEIEELRDQTASSFGVAISKIFDAHISLLTDPHVIDPIHEAIRGQCVTAEYAVYSRMQQLHETFRRGQNPLARKHASDVLDLEQRILKHLIGTDFSDLGTLDHQAVVVAHDLTPSQTAALDRTKIRGLATDAGGQTSHTAILAHALGIPAIVGLEDITARVRTGDSLIVDGHRGLVVINPDAAKLMEYRQVEQRMAAFTDTLGEIKSLPAVTKDGTKITLLANIEFPSEIPEAIANGAEGIGLYRTEFLYLASEVEPSEQEQYETYLQAIQSLKGRPMTIRTLDLGADKISESLRPFGPEHEERNPFLGCRSIRLCLQNLPLFKTQLRAILRASEAGPVRIMFPLISNIMELRQARMILSDVKEDLEEQAVPYRSDIPTGMMIEVPSVAIQSRTFAREVDFFSIGTNDLIQYTVAVDRSNELIANLYSAAHPALMTLLKEILRAAQGAKLDVSLCGEMGGEPEFTMLLLGLGLRTLSISPPAIPEIKQIVRSVSIDQCRRVVRKVRALDSEREVLNCLKDEVGKIMPEVFDGRSVGY